METIDRSEIIHEIDNFVSPIKAGVTNTEQLLYEYQFTADNELDYSASIADTTTVTFSELPANTRSILVYMRVKKSGDYTFLRYRRNVADTQEYFCQIYAAGVANIQLDVICEFFTDGNTIYIVNEETTVDYFIIMGYKEKV